MKTEPEPILCYVKDNWAYFTTQSLEKQKGHDWNDTPYEHNAGPPSEHNPNSNVESWKIVKVAWEGELEAPNKYGSYSVDEINAKLVPWLRQSSWKRNIEQNRIYAGTPLSKFVDLVKEADGHVYMQVETRNVYTL